MTLIAAIEGQDGIVLTSDSRATIGDPRGLTAIHDVHKKIFKLSGHCGIAVSGASELANRFIDSLYKVLSDKKLVDIDPIVNEILGWGKKEYAKWFGTRPWISTTQQGQITDQRPGIIFIVCGFNKQTNKRSRIYLLNSALDFAPQLCKAGHMLAGVPQYAIYLMHRLYNPQMKLVNVRSLAAYLITETATQDPKVGGPVQMAEINLEKGYQELSEDLIHSIIKMNDEQNIKLREFFYKGEKNDRKN